jgi:hypothetical protein
MNLFDRWLLIIIVVLSSVGVHAYVQDRSEPIYRAQNY